MSSIRNVRPWLRKAAQPGLAVIAQRWPKEISAMVRIRNEEEWVYQSITSIADQVDQLVLVDNMSTDRTPDLIRQIVSEHPAKTSAYSYPHRIARQGAENLELASSPGMKRSPRLLSNYYNWCLAWCNKPYVLKWDADEIATDELARSLNAFRKSNKYVMTVCGRNVHPSLECAVADGPPVVEAPEGFWRAVPSMQAYEPRLFPKRFARHVSSQLWESLASPYLQPVFTLRWDRPVFLHMALCREQPFANASPNDRQQRLVAGVKPGEALNESERAALRRWHR